MKLTGTDRRTLKKIPYTPQPKELYQEIVTSPGWGYKRNKDKLLTRDRSLIALTYLGAFRISETLRIRAEDFIPVMDKKSGNTHYIEIRAVELSKSFKKGKPRNDLYRTARLPLSGDRSKFTDLVLEWVNIVKHGKLYQFGNTRAWQIITSFLPGATCHWLRAYGERYLYNEWDNDLVAVADYVKVDERTLAQYLRGTWMNKPVA
jgi:hypothetical protein